MVEHKVTFGRKVKKVVVRIEKNAGLLSIIYQVSLLRGIVKWIIRLITGTCELQRILTKHHHGARTLQLEEYMHRSKLNLLRETVEREPGDIDEAIEQIMIVKKIISDTNPSFVSSMKACLEQIYGFEALVCNIESMRKEKYDCNNKCHEALLLQLWNLLQPDIKLSNRISKQWGDIGFQGDDPKTDFRGMGMLGLRNLVFFAEKHTDQARQVLLHSHHPKHGYSYAIVGINITSMAHEVLLNGLLRTHFYNHVLRRPNEEDFHEVFCYLFYEFDKFWMKSEPENVMAFGQVREDFKQKVDSVLCCASTVKLSVE